MEKKERLRLQRELADWYRTAHRRLPWRENTDPYRVWVSEVMLQQTRVETVIPYYQRFMERFPTLKSLADADGETLMKLWEGLGYYSRARNLWQSARILCRDYGGRLPGTREELIRLPGIGDYIAAAVLSIAFQQPAAVVDGNVKRILARLFMEKAAVNDPGAKQTFTALAEGLLDERNPGQFNQAMMELGQRICTPGVPDCPVCPIRSGCRAFRNQMTDDYPRRLRKKSTPLKKMIFAVVMRGECLLILRRPDQGLLGGLWEFPGNEPEGNGAGEEMARAIIHRQTGIRADVLRLLGTVRHAYTHFRISADVYLCGHLSGEVGLNGHTAHLWVRPEKLREYALHKMIHKMLPLLPPHPP
ncbi:MAG: A/G-specific adenine glycosylase [Thermodesulfobacteriota bacterium]